MYVAKGAGSEIDRCPLLALQSVPGATSCPFVNCLNQILWRRCGISGHHLENSHDPVSRLAGLSSEHLSVFCAMLFPGLESRTFLVTSFLQASNVVWGASEASSRDGSSEDPLASDALKSPPLPA